jgi:hypothetical protein
MHVRRVHAGKEYERGQCLLAQRSTFALLESELSTQRRKRLGEIVIMFSAIRAAFARGHGNCRGKATAAAGRQRYQCRCFDGKPQMSDKSSRRKGAKTWHNCLPQAGKDPLDWHTLGHSSFLYQLWA